MAYLIPVIIVCVVGIVAGVLLTIAAKIMYVPVDEKSGTAHGSSSRGQLRRLRICRLFRLRKRHRGKRRGRNSVSVGGPSVSSALAAVMGSKPVLWKANTPSSYAADTTTRQIKIFRISGYPYL